VDWFSRHKFLILLAAMAFLMVFYPLLHRDFQSRLVWSVLMSFLYLATFFVTFTERRLRLPAVCLAVPTIVGAWVGYALPVVPPVAVAAGFHLLAVVFFVFTTASILFAIHRAGDVTADSVFGAFCGYILVGLSFGHAYCALETLAPGSFHLATTAPSDFAGQDRLFYLLGYFSLVTLTTVGYGDILALSHGARGLAVVEAIVGQFYIAVLIGELIGKRVAAAVSPAPPADSKL
jgi:hypothetical protein